MLTISNYHYIRPDYNFNYPSIFGVTLDGFKQQLELLKNEGEFVTPNELVTNHKELLKSKDNYYFVTFDDGLKEQYQYALPILDELDISAVFFANSRNFQEKKVSTVHKIHLLRSLISPNDFINELNRFGIITHNDDFKVKAKNIYLYDDEKSAVLKYVLNYQLDFSKQEEIISIIFNSYYDEIKVLNELYMSENEIIDLASKSYLGSHTHSHFPLGLLNEEQIKFELQNSKTYLENLTKFEIDMVAYPYGTPEACTEEVGFLAKESNYKLGFTTTRGVNAENDDLLLLNRFDCNDLIGGKNFKKI